VTNFVYEIRYPTGAVIQRVMDLTAEERDLQRQAREARARVRE